MQKCPTDYAGSPEVHHRAKRDGIQILESPKMSFDTQVTDTNMETLKLIKTIKYLSQQLKATQNYSELSQKNIDLKERNDELENKFD